MLLQKPRTDKLISSGVGVFVFWRFLSSTIRKGEPTGVRSGCNVQPHHQSYTLDLAADADSAKTCRVYGVKDFVMVRIVLQSQETVVRYEYA